MEAKLAQIPKADSPVYSPNDTYLAVINSDGDNMQVGLRNCVTSSINHRSRGLPEDAQCLLGILAKHNFHKCQWQVLPKTKISFK